MYATTTASGKRAFHSRNSSAVIEVASEQPARKSGSNTVFSGQRIAAVSAMKCTPQKTITSASVLAARLRKPQRIGHEIGDFLHLGALVMMGQDHCVALATKFAYARLLSPDLLRRVGASPRRAEAYSGFRSPSLVVAGVILFVSVFGL